MESDRQRVTVLIADDEPAARRGIRKLLGEHASAEIVGECSNGLETVEAITRLTPDLVYLDIQMPELSGFEVIEKIGVESMPTTIFVTAYDQYALKAFETHALDYVLKPIDEERFRASYLRAERRIRLDRASDLGDRLRAVLLHMERREREGGREEYLERVVIKEAGRIFFLDARNIILLEAAGNYVTLHTERDRHLFRETMINMEGKLNPKQFVRVSRSVILNIDYVREFRPLFKGSYQIVLLDGSKIRSGRHFRANIDALFSKTR